jgi:hypothetical protein
MRDVRWIRILSGTVGVAPVLYAAAVAFMLWVAAFGLAGGLPLAYLLAAFAVWMSANYLLEIVEHRAVGNAGWAVLSVDTIAGGRAQIGSLFLVLVLALGAALWALGRLAEPALVYSCAALLAAFFPAAAALLAVTRNAAHALNPGAIAGAVVRMGLDYVVVLVAMAGAIALGVLANGQREFIPLFLAVYAWLLVAFLLGSLVYERRTALGVYAPRSPEARQEADYQRLLSARRHALGHAYGIAAAGNMVGALAYVEEYARSESDALAAKVWLFHEMARWENVAAALELGVGLSAALGAQARHADAAKVLVTCRYLQTKGMQRRP